MEGKIAWRVVDIKTLRAHLSKHLLEYDEWLVSQSYSPNTRKLYMDLLKAMLRKIDPRKEDEWDAYAGGFSKNTRGMRKSVRRSWFKFVGVPLDFIREYEKINPPNSEELESRKKTNTKLLYKRKAKSFSRLVSDVILGQELGFISETLEELVADGRTIFNIRKTFNLDGPKGPQISAESTERPIVNGKQAYSIHTDPTPESQAELLNIRQAADKARKVGVETATIKDGSLFIVATDADKQLASMAELLGLDVDDIVELQRLKPAEFETMRKQLLQ